MPTYTDVDNNELSEATALSLAEGKTFKVEWEDGEAVECLAERDGTWSVAHRRGGALHYYGGVAREGDMFRATSLPQFSAQETFSAAARKYL